MSDPPRRYRGTALALYALAAISCGAMAMGWAVWIVGFIVAGVGLLIIDILRRPRWW